MRSFPASGWTITHIHSEDWRHPSTARPARVLLLRERTQGHVLPTRADGHQLHGAILSEIDPAEWVPLDPRVEWRPGRVPVIHPGPPIHLDFVEQSTLARRRTEEADRMIATALDPAVPVQEAEGLLELADGLLGGHVVPLAAQMHLARADPSRHGRLRTRFLRAAPSGQGRFEALLDAFPRVRSDLQATDNMRAAMGEVLREPLDAEAWTPMRAETLARWWLRWRMSHENLTIGGMARRMEVAPNLLRSLLRAGSGLAALTELPSPEHMLRDLASLPERTGSPLATALADVHRPHLALLARQLATLERLTGRGERLDRWDAATEPIAEGREWMRTLNDAPSWERARDGSETLYHTLLAVDVRAPLNIARCLECFGVAIAGAALGARDLACALSVARETGPIIALAPGYGVGVTRFSIAHQLGHLLDPDTDGASPCTLTNSDPDESRSPSESFANAFAVYLLAPRPAVMSQLKGVDLTKPATIFDAAADVAALFGLSAGAALRHVLNCSDTGDARPDLGRMLKHPDWSRRRAAIDDEVDAAWSADRVLIDSAIRSSAGWSVEAALRRPSMTRFDELTDRAVSAKLLSLNAARALRAS